MIEHYNQEYLQYLFTYVFSAIFIPYYYMPFNYKYLREGVSTKDEMVTHFWVYFGTPMVSLTLAFFMLYLPSIYENYSFDALIEQQAPYTFAGAFSYFMAGLTYKLYHGL